MTKLHSNSWNKIIEILEKNEKKYIALRTPNKNNFDKNDFCLARPPDKNGFDKNDFNDWFDCWRKFWEENDKEYFAVFVPKYIFNFKNEEHTKNLIKEGALHAIIKFPDERTKKSKNKDEELKKEEELKEILIFKKKNISIEQENNKVGLMNIESEMFKLEVKDKFPEISLEMGKESYLEEVFKNSGKPKSRYISYYDANNITEITNTQHGKNIVNISNGIEEMLNYLDDTENEYLNKNHKILAYHYIEKNHRINQKKLVLKDGIFWKVVLNETLKENNYSVNFLWQNLFLTKTVYEVKQFFLRNKKAKL